MKLFGVIIKSLKEQIRSLWVLLLTLSMGPLFIFIYFLITESSNPRYRILLLNQDAGVMVEGKMINHGSFLASFIVHPDLDSLKIPFTLEEISDRDKGTEMIKNNKAEALIVLHPSFSSSIALFGQQNAPDSPVVEFVGDLTKTGYLISAVWANEIIHEFGLRLTNSKRVIHVKETPLGTSGKISEFDMLVPGILILSLIMLMFTASIAFVTEVEHKTILRLKLSNVSPAEFLGGVSFVQLLVGIASLLVTLITAVLLGFQYAGSLLVMIMIAGLTSLSIIAFSLIIAAATKSANEVLVVGNFPMFLFMFFTGAAFPIKSEPLFTIAGYPINFQGLMTPTHAISALNKTLVMDMGLKAIIPEISAIIILTIFYFVIGAFFFKHRHLKMVTE
jgi:ABC-type multidrug transport system permease subunit